MNLGIIKVSKIAFDIMFFLGILAIVLVIGLTVASPVIVDVIQDAEPATTSGTVLGVDVSIDASDLDDAAATRLAVAAGSAIAVSLAVGTYIVHQIRRALRAVLDGRAFRTENYDRLRRIAYAVFALIPIGIVFDSWIGTITHGSFQLDLSLPVTTIAAGLLALAVAELYKAGITLEDDAELTV